MMRAGSYFRLHTGIYFSLRKPVLSLIQHNTQTPTSRRGFSLRRPEIMWFQLRRCLSARQKEHKALIAFAK